ncbi:MAG: ComEC/Rec2 family competence protein, partial [Chloroflexi bacterium]|nr:ComEC/Rec2 family competence protein [Chloroflexota bacterium]
KELIPLVNGLAGTPRPVNGLLQVTIPPGGDWQYGDLVQLEGKPQTPKDSQDFSYKEYLARQGIYSQMIYPRIWLVKRSQGNPFLTGLYWLRQRSYQTINRSLPQPEAALLNGILLGLDKDLPADVQQAFRDTGTAHIIAISGFNIAIVAGLFSTLFLRVVPRLWAPLFVVLAISAYTLMVGAGPSVVRAAIMAGLSLFGQQIGRRQAGLSTLAFTAAVMCLFTPTQIYDVSFQLSFAATLGLVLFADRLQQWFIRLAQRWFPATLARRLAQPAGEFFLFTLAAQVVTLPVMAYHFQAISLIAILANPLVLPAQELLMVLGGAALLIGLVIPPLSRLAGWLVWPLLAFTIRSVEFLAQIKGGSLVLGGAEVWSVMLFGLALVGLAVMIPRRPGWPGWLAPAGLLALALLAAVTWWGVLRAPDGRLHLTVLGGEDGPAVFLQTPGGSNLLVNGVKESSALSSALGRRLSPLTRQLGVLILTDPAPGIMAGLPAALERFPAQQAYISQGLPASSALAGLQTSLKQQNTLVNVLEMGQVLDLGSGIRLRALDSSEQGMALLLEYGSFRALLPGGFSLAGLEKRTDWPGKIDLLILNQKDLPDQPAASWSQFPVTAVVFSGNKPATIAPASTWLDLAQRDWVSIVTDGQKMWVEVGR